MMNNEMIIYESRERFAAFVFLDYILMLEKK